jgi:hypothetical protein
MEKPRVENFWIRIHGPGYHPVSATLVGKIRISILTILLVPKNITTKTHTLPPLSLCFLCTPKRYFLSALYPGLSRLVVRGAPHPRFLRSPFSPVPPPPLLLFRPPSRRSEVTCPGAAAAITADSSSVVFASNVVFVEEGWSCCCCCCWSSVRTSN